MAADAPSDTGRPRPSGDEWGTSLMNEHGFDKDYWDEHWHEAVGADDSGAGRRLAPNPHLVSETRDLAPGTALDAGCGEGLEASWLASRGWDVTAADISSEALARAAARATERDAAIEEEAGTPGRVQWVEADLSAWEPAGTYDLVMTHYAHPAMPQLAFYRRIADWVAPGGTLLVVGHLHHGSTGDGHHPPARASVTAADVTAALDPALWAVVTAEERSRATGSGHEGAPLHDVVVRATRRVLPE